ncbi:hypothetical protein [Sandaracinus amylolyticus]|nr:hypothetical protein [Sandaracinus amylolyticus]
MNDLCPRCGRARHEGAHDLSEAERRALRPSFCPKCSGGPDDAHPRCASETTLFYQCSCGVRWTCPR